MSTLYIITNTAGDNQISITPGTLNGPGSTTSDTDLKLYGQGSLAYGQGTNENILRIAECFACPEKAGSPGVPQDSTDLGVGNGINNPINGQLWFNTTTGNLLIYDESITSFVQTGGATVSATEPSNPGDGDLWYDTAVPQLKIYNGSIFISVADRYYLRDGSDDITGNVQIKKNAPELHLESDDDSAPSIKFQNSLDTDRASVSVDLSTGSISLESRDATGTITGSATLAVDGNVTVNASVPTAAGHLTRKDYCDTTFVDVAGDTMTGALIADSTVTVNDTLTVSSGNTFAFPGGTAGTGDGNVTAGSDIEFSASGLISADDTLFFNIDGTNNSTGSFVINKGKLFNDGTETALFTIENTGHIKSNITTYESLVTTDDSIPNKKYVDDYGTSNFVELTGDTMSGTLTNTIGGFVGDLTGDVAGNLAVADSGTITLGDSNDLTIYHDASDSYVDQIAAATGDLYLRNLGTNGTITLSTNAGAVACVVVGGTNNSAELNYGGSKKVETTSGGASVTGTLTASTGFDVTGGTGTITTGTSAAGATSALRITDDSNHHIELHDRLAVGNLNPLVAADDKGIIFGGNLVNSATSLTIAPWSDDKLGIRIDDSTNKVVVHAVSGFEANHNNSLKLNTKSTGITVTGEMESDSIDVTNNIVVGGTVDGRDVAADGTRLDTMEDNADVTDATNVEAAGAVMESDTTTASMSFVIDEDDMLSDSATKVPTQQSVKKYVDDEVSGAGIGITKFANVQLSSTWWPAAAVQYLDKGTFSGLTVGDHVVVTHRNYPYYITYASCEIINSTTIRFFYTSASNSAAVNPEAVTAYRTAGPWYVDVLVIPA